jgi:molybdopterin/thiamine biosynthesis adenylyltransferase
MPPNLSDKEKIRYDRQIRIRNWGAEVQLKIKKSKVIIIGAGGLGSPASIYLTAAGVGNLLIIDSEEFELSNLNRQILANTEDIGSSKAEVATRKLHKLNPEIEISYNKIKLTEDNIEKVLKGAHVVLDALDNWKTRFIVNKICVNNNIPLSHGGVTELGGQAFTIIPKRGPCLECMFKNIPEVDGGFAVLGVTPGIIGTIQALEVIKLITGLGKPLYDRMLVFDGYETSFEYIPIKRNEQCDVCGGQ